jgi:hypothetical protein
MSMSVEKIALGTQATPLTTGATLANNALAISAAYNNTIGGGSGDGYARARFTLNVTFSVAPAASTGISVWLLTSEDGTTYEDGDASTTPARPPDIVIPVRAVTTAQQIARDAYLPPGLLKVLAKNDATGQTMSSGWTLKLLPYTPTAV